MSNIYRISATLAAQAPNCAPTLLRGEFVQSISRAAKMGYDGVELQFLISSGIDVGEITEACASTDMKVCALATGSLYTKGGLSLIDEREQIVSEAIVRLKQYIDVAKTVGGKVIIGCVRGNVPPDGDVDACIRRLAVNMRPVLDYANGAGVPVVIEAINHYENNYLNTSAECIEFIEANRMDGLTVLLDTYHMNMEEKNMGQAIRTAGKLLGHVHLVDNTRRVPGMGQMEYKPIFDALDEIGYGGWLSFESSVESDEDREAASGLEFIRALMALRD